MMDFDHDKIDEAALALLFLTLHDDHRAWKGLDWGALNRLHEKGLIFDPVNKAKSVMLTDVGNSTAEDCARRLFGSPPVASEPGKIERRLEALGETLPAPKQAVANYLGCKQSGSTLYVSGRVSPTRGEVGTDLTREQAQVAAKEALLDILAIIKAEIGDLDRIESVEKMIGFVRSASTFSEQPAVIDGASDLLIALFGEEGRHARTATGVAQLPFGAAVQLEMVLRLADD